MACKMPHFLCQKGKYYKLRTFVLQPFVLRQSSFVSECCWGPSAALFTWSASGCTAWMLALFSPQLPSAEDNGLQVTVISTVAARDQAHLMNAELSQPFSPKTFSGGDGMGRRPVSQVTGLTHICIFSCGKLTRYYNSVNLLFNLHVQKHNARKKAFKSLEMGFEDLTGPASQSGRDTRSSGNNTLLMTVPKGTGGQPQESDLWLPEDKWPVNDSSPILTLIQKHCPSLSAGH